MSDNKQNRRTAEVKLPAYVQHRMQAWDTYKAARLAENKARSNSAIQITLPDGKIVDGKAFLTTPLDVATGISKGLAQACIVAKVDGGVWDLTRPFENSCRLELCKFDSPEGEYTFWHSSAHVLGEALELKYQDAKLCIGPPVEDGGFYYDVKLPEDQKVGAGDFKAIEQIIKQVTKKKQDFERLELSKEEALEMFRFNPFKLQLIGSKVPDGGKCTAYRCGPLIDLCRGPHIPHTKMIKAMTVTKNSSAYWLGNADNASLQRVYGISFPDKKRMKAYKKMVREAEKRDHRKLGVQQKLFFFHQLSPGSCFFLPHGARIYNKLVQFIQGEYRKRGYDEVVTPNVFNVDLWRTSGHYANYKENMFMFEAEGVEFGLKPMNCPGHCLMFKHHLHSYRDLPIRYADFGVLHRNELSGALTGLTRVRRFQQDDAHIFARHDQIEQEVLGVIDMLQFCYGIFGFKFDLQLSTRPAKFLGALHLWDNAEAALARVLASTGLPWTINHADGAFYGPKIDIQLRDALGRKHQCATIQLDFQLPLRFDLSYKAQDGKKARPVMIHRAVLGSVERMFAVLVEHTAGKWPLWLSPRQVRVVPVDLKFLDTAVAVKNRLHQAGFFVDVADSTKKFNKKVRESYIYNIIAVIGPREVEDGTVTITFSQTKQQQTLSVDEFIELAQKLVADYK